MNWPNWPPNLLPQRFPAKFTGIERKPLFFTIVVSACTTCSYTCVYEQVAQALTTKSVYEQVAQAIMTKVKNEGLSPGCVIYTCPLPSVVLTSLLRHLTSHVLQGLALGYRTQVCRPSFFTFVISACATRSYTCVCERVAQALMTWSSTTDSESKRFYSEPDAVEYNKDSKPQHDLILGTKP